MPSAEPALSRPKTVLEVIPTGQQDVYQGVVKLEGSPIYAFLIQPEFEPVVWVMGAGDVVRGEEHLRRALSAILTAAMVPVEGLGEATAAAGVTVAPSGDVVTRQQMNEEATRAWRAGLKAAASTQSTNQYNFLQSLHWPEGVARALGGNVGP